jgi:hypothetical protein
MTMDNEPPDGANGEKQAGGDAATFSNVINFLFDVEQKLRTQNIKTAAAVKIRDEVSKEIIHAIELLETMRDGFADNAITTLPAIKEELRKLNEEKAKTYAQATATVTPTSKSPPDPRKIKVRERNKTRQERAKCEVALLATTESTKERLLSMTYKEITEGIQNTINSNVQGEDKPTLLGVSKPTKDGTIRIHCETEDEANMLREINWEAATTKGIQARKPKYGIVIHGVNKDNFNTAIDNNKPTIERIEKENTLPVAKIVPLRRKLNKESPTHSIVVFTTDAHAADRCIKRGMYLNYCLYNTE